MIRTQISLDEPQMEALRALARKRKVSVASMLREAVDALLEHDSPDPRERARAVTGRFRAERSGTASIDHDAAVADAYAS